ncbi:MAG: hypothetical protein KJO54_03560 [Gammaproteobacteria bacterium]|nr:hypothetical protein [Gammaproteobacteria bacterium]NNF60857.1 hypothetical protein [Gammaproteobacteria bacterium]NNM21754.1 hypothetical protein [Gammaproteobacteria bacterium]
MKLHVLMLLIVLAASGCAIQSVTAPAGAVKAWSADSQHDRNLMVGKWLGEVRTEDDKLRITLSERSENGTYRITFRTYEGSQYDESIEVGLWGISGPVYFTIMRGWMTGGEFRPADTTQAYYYDAYRIISLDETSFEYESVETANRFSVRRVGNDFEFSD